MRIVDSYFVQLENGAKAWLAVSKPVPENATVLEVRPMLIPEYGMVLRHKETGDISNGHWLRGDDAADKWEEIEEPKEVEQ